MALLSKRFLARGPLPRIVIIGGSYAGLSAARALAGSACHVTLIDRTDEAEWLPNVHELLSRRKTAAQLQASRAALLHSLGHDFRLADISHIDTAAQRLHSSQGERMDYDLLLLATGSRAHDHGIPGVHEHALHPRGVAQCQRIGNALTRLAALPAGRDVVLAGGGIEGLEMLGEILQRFGHEGRLQLHLVEQQHKLFPSLPGLHERLLQKMQGQVQVHTGRRISAVHADRIELDDGSQLPSRLTLWSGGRQSQPLPATAGLASPGADAPVHNTLQSLHADNIFIAGDAALLPEPLQKQAFYAQDMGVHAAANMQRQLAQQDLLPFQPLHKPVVMSFGDRDGVMFYHGQALASASLIALKEGIYSVGIQQWQSRQQGRGRQLLQLAGRLQRGMSELELWQLLLKSRDSEIFLES